jgi:hypothetical protein
LLQEKKNLLISIVFSFIRTLQAFVIADLCTLIIDYCKFQEIERTSYINEVERFFREKKIQTEETKTNEEKEKETKTKTIKKSTEKYGILKVGLRYLNSVVQIPENVTVLELCQVSSIYSCVFREKLRPIYQQDWLEFCCTVAESNIQAIHFNLRLNDDPKIGDLTLEHFALLLSCIKTKRQYRSVKLCRVSFPDITCEAELQKQNLLDQVCETLCDLQIENMTIDMCFLSLLTKSNYFMKKQNYYFPAQELYLSNGCSHTDIFPNGKIQLYFSTVKRIQMSYIVWSNFSRCSNIQKRVDFDELTSYISSLNNFRNNDLSSLNSFKCKTLAFPISKYDLRSITPAYLICILSSLLKLYHTEPSQRLVQRVVLSFEFWEFLLNFEAQFIQNNTIFYPLDANSEFCLLEYKSMIPELSLLIGVEKPYEYYPTDLDDPDMDDDLFSDLKIFL